MYLWVAKELEVRCRRAAAGGRLVDVGGCGLGWLWRNAAATDGANAVGGGWLGGDWWEGGFAFVDDIGVCPAVVPGETG